jgi:hypothetical protein
MRSQAGCDGGDDGLLAGGWLALGGGLVVFDPFDELLGNCAR